MKNVIVEKIGTRIPESYKRFFGIIPSSYTKGIKGAESVDNIVTINQIDYDSLGDKDDKTLYLITE